MRKLVLIVLILLAAAVALAATTSNELVYPMPPATVACDDTGLISFNPDPTDVRWDVWNSGANDVCVAWCGTDCTGQAPDRTSVATCSFVLGAYAGTGTPDVWTVSASLHGSRHRSAAAVFECDASAATNLVVTAWRKAN